MPVSIGMVTRQTSADFSAHVLCSAATLALTPLQRKATVQREDPKAQSH
jgi:hypothetical protein